MTHSYIRAYRRRSALSQEQLGLLLGISRNATHDLERGKKVPSLPVALRLYAVFGVPLHKLFSGQYEVAEEATMAAAVRLHNGLEGKTDRASVVRRAFLETMPKRGMSNGPVALAI